MVCPAVRWIGQGVAQRQPPLLFLPVLCARRECSVHKRRCAPTSSCAEVDARTPGHSGEFVCKCAGVAFPLRDGRNSHWRPIWVRRPSSETTPGGVGGLLASCRQVESNTCTL